MKVLENFYAYELDASKVDYLRFIADVDLVFTTPVSTKTILNTFF